jgi:hypothetical protein
LRSSINDWLKEFDSKLGIEDPAAIQFNQNAMLHHGIVPAWEEW